MISVILNVYKRPHMLDKQIDAVLSQSVEVKAEDIHVWYNPSGVDQPLPANKKVNTYHSSWNTKFFGRFTIPLLCKTEYVAIFDDDNLPMEHWFRSCLHTMSEHNGILGGTGVRIHNGRKKNRMHITKAGWNGDHLDHTDRVDYVGQAWFFRQAWSKYLWYETPRTWDNGEDIMFSYLAQKYGGINTFVPPHPEGDKSVWSTDYNTAWDEGRDGNASWRIKSHTGVRDDIHQWCIDNGWDTLNKL